MSPNNMKIVLAFFLVVVAAAMVFVWLFYPPTGDANALALLAGFVMLFIKMAADATGYQFSSSAGSDKKDETQAKVASSLAEKVAPPTVAPWWSRLNDAERTAIADAKDDPRVQLFKSTAEVGRATQDDLAYLVTKGLLTQERATAIQSA